MYSSLDSVTNKPGLKFLELLAVFNLYILHETKLDKSGGAYTYLISSYANTIDCIALPPSLLLWSRWIISCWWPEGTWLHLLGREDLNWNLIGISLVWSRKRCCHSLHWLTCSLGWRDAYSFTILNLSVRIWIAYLCIWMKDIVDSSLRSICFNLVIRLRCLILLLFFNRNVPWNLI